MEELTENAEEGDEEDKQSEQKLGRLNFKVSSRVSTPKKKTNSVFPSELRKASANSTSGLQHNN